MAKSAFVKDFAVEQELKNNGIEIGVWDGDKQFGDIYVAKTGIIWCDGKVTRRNGTKISFDELSLLCRNLDEAKQAAKDAEKTK
ncbi:hypothetical protein HME9302_00826 [Alteripontixanthobacter maritimus]|uniref:Uncharacterized protein n=1 Tax=Alteripontixanthobacter maritimus TaxID=2161824 RepID=A0A369Q902_9SPHN|nr:hypothetical protein [Alteripontixanthobacter maritimus]RDC59636.1 hypothetical protein HME9302_00826 [Alteripontixanthobacter maritimus]